MGRAPTPLRRVIPPGGEERWSATLQPAAAGMTTFGVYPLAAQVLSDVGAPVATDRTFLPFWPGNNAPSRPRPLSIAWIWPLIDQPYQAACPALFSNALASRLAPGGRLGKLLAAGARNSAAAHLTWAIDPALVQNADTMTRRYAVGGFPDCGNAMSLPASQAARAWLSGLSGATAGQQVFLTPYGDADVAALSHVGLDPDLIRAFADRKIGQQILRPAVGQRRHRLAGRRACRLERARQLRRQPHQDGGAGLQRDAAGRRSRRATPPARRPPRPRASGRG